MNVPILFTVEYLVRLASVRRPRGYALSFFGVIDLLAIIPTYLSLVVAGTQSLLVIRILRLLRVFRVFKLGYYLSEARVLKTAIQASRAKINVFLTLVLSIAVVMGALLYLIEGEATGFTTIPRGMYWAVVTMTTVGYGDIAPTTVLGQIAAAGLLVLGYAIIAIPTGIVSAEPVQARQPSTGVDAGLSRLQRRGPRCRRGLLQVLRRAPLSHHDVEVASQGRERWSQAETRLVRRPWAGINTRGHGVGHSGSPRSRHVGPVAKRRQSRRHRRPGARQCAPRGPGE